MWAAVASMGIQMAQAYGQASVSKAQAEANTRLSKVQATNDRRTRDASNAFSAARGALQRYVQGMQNNNTLEAGGELLEQNLVNARRREDAMIGATFEQQIRDAEQLGAQAAAAAFTGAQGETSDMVSISTRLMQQRAERQALTERGYASYDTARRAASIATQTSRSLDSSLILDSMDYSVTPAMTQKAPSVWGTTLMTGLNAAIGSGLFKNMSFGSSAAPAMDTFDYGSAMGASYPMSI